MKGYLFYVFCSLVCGLVLSAAGPAVAGGSCAGGACATATIEVPVVVGVTKVAVAPLKVVARIVERQPVQKVVVKIREAKPVRSAVGGLLERKPARKALAGIVRALRR